MVFSVRFCKRNGRAGGREREKSVLYRGCSGLLYEILIPGDIQQAYIRLACKSPPYLISRGCDAPGNDGSFYAAATFPSLRRSFFLSLSSTNVGIVAPLERAPSSAQGFRFRGIASKIAV